jgi:hypothetical protein
MDKKEIKEKKIKKLKIFLDKIDTKLNWLKTVKNSNLKKKIKLINKMIMNKK